MFADLYTWLKLAHVVSALVFFGLEGAYGVRKAALGRAADFAGLRSAFAAFEAVVKLAGNAALVILLSGLALMATAWGWDTAWANLALGLFVANIVITAVIDMPWSRAMREALEGRHGPLTQAARALEQDPRMHLSHTLKTGVDFALVFLMVVKPGLWAAVGGAALIIAAYTAFNLLRHNTGGAASAKLAREV